MMTSGFPYTRVSCPCDTQLDFTGTAASSRRSTLPVRLEDDEDEEDKTLNPHDPRSSFSLYPYDRLLYCDECQQIRCPRCWAEEVTNWYCPSCLFEVPSSQIKADGNRCMRNCYNCPLCTAPLSVNALDQHPSGQEGAGPSGPFFLACPVCEWSSLDAGIELSKPNKVSEQLHRVRRPKRLEARDSSMTESDTQDLPSTSIESAITLKDTSTPEQRYNSIAKFYRTQLSESDVGASNPFGLDASYASPSNLARIVQIYGGLSAASLKKAREKPQPMREALNNDEGLITFSPKKVNDEPGEYTGPSSIFQTSTRSQKTSHTWNHNAHRTTDLWPIPTILRTKTSKRCRACRHILIRHDDTRSKSSTSSSTSSAITSGKYKIRLLAQNNVPRLSLRPFSTTAYISASTPQPRPYFALTSAALHSATEPTSGIGILRPGQTKHLLLLITNPLFDPVRISLATPQITPGKVGSRVTILCPTFDVGADGDMWDSALDSGGSGAGLTRPGARDKGGKELAGGAGQWREKGKDGEEKVPEAGKVWERGRNWVGVVVEVVPGSLLDIMSEGADEVEKGGEEEDGLEVEYEEWVKRERRRKLERSIDDDVLEIPIFVKAEWEADVAGEEGGKMAREKRDIGFWCVLGVGKIIA